MSGDPYDVQGEVRDALSTAVNSYGKRVLSDPRVLGNLVTDLLPDNPRERSLLVTAAEAGIAGELTQNVEGQHMDAETAVALAAQSLTDNRSLDRAASLWVATAYAKALGYQVQSQALPPSDSAPSSPGAQAPGHDPTILANQPVAPWSPPPAASPWGQAPTSAPSPAAPNPWGQGQVSAPVPAAPNPWGQGPASAPAAPNPWGQAPTSAPSPAAPNPWGQAPTPNQAPNQAANQDPNGWAPTSTSNPVVNANGWAPTSTSNPSPNAWTPAASSPSPNAASNPSPAPEQAAWAAPSPAPSNPWSPTPPAPQGQWPAAPSAPAKSHRGLFLGGGTAAAIIVAYVAIAAVAGVFPFSKSTSNPTPVTLPSLSSPTAHPSNSLGSPTADPTPTGSGTPTGSSVPTGTLAAGVKPLKVLMPYDIQDANTECVEQAKIPWTNPGLVRGLECTAPDMPDGQIFGYQLDNHSDYLKAWANYNSWAEFGTSKTLDCPPASGNSQGGPEEWWGPRFAKRAGQVIECFTSDSGPVYIWTYPTENTFMVSQPPKSWAFSKLEKWWENNAV